MDTSMTAKLYAAPLSLYSGKARAYLDWKGVDYIEILATPDVYRDIIIPDVGRPVIPVLATGDGAILQDTTVIIDHFESTAGGPSIYPATPRQHLAALLLECFGDEWLVIPAMHYRWNYNEDWVYGEFGAVALPDGTPEEQAAVGRERGATFRGFVPVLGINDATIPAIEASYEQLLRDLDAHFDSHDFLFGSRPSIGDYGLIGPLYAHLYRDPASGEIMRRIAPGVVHWVERMIKVDVPQSGTFLTDDAIPDTLLPILSRMMAEQLPYLERTAAMLGEWMAQTGGDEPPRAVGMAQFTIEGVTGERIATPFSLWMLQRALDYLASLDGADMQACEQLLRSVGGEDLSSLHLPARLTFKDHRLRVERASS